MKKIRLAIITSCLLVLLTSNSHAGGSVTLSDIQPLIQQQPLLWKFFSDHLDISQNGGGLRLGSVGIPLQGYRVGPYEFPARIKGSEGAYDLKVIINTDLYFLDANGKEVTDEKLAFKKEEVLKGISLELQKPPIRNGSFIQSAQ